MENRWSDWRPWTGGPCPVDADIIVEVLLSDGTLTPMPAKNIGWDFPQDPVVAYRVRNTCDDDNLNCPSSEFLGQLAAWSKRRSGASGWCDYAADLR